MNLLLKKARRRRRRTNTVVPTAFAPFGPLTLSALSVPFGAGGYSMRKAAGRGFPDYRWRPRERISYTTRWPSYRMPLMLACVLWVCPSACVQQADASCRTLRRAIIIRNPPCTLKEGRHNTGSATSTTRKQGGAAGIKEAGFWRRVHRGKGEKGLPWRGYYGEMRKEPQSTCESSTACIGEAAGRARVGAEVVGIGWQAEWSNYCDDRSFSHR